MTAIGSIKQIAVPFDVLQRQQQALNTTRSRNPEGLGTRNVVQQVTEFLTAAEVAGILRVSLDTVIRRFEQRKGVIDLGSGEGRFKRRYRVLRIPREALEGFITESRVAA